MNFTAESLFYRLLFLVPMILSLSVHEFAHAWSAFKLGDDTAERQGRMTLNPLAHIDPVGTILLPLLGVPFGWAKPVPVNPARFRRTISMGRGMMLTAIAGPLSNLLIAIIGSVIYGLLIRWTPDAISHKVGVSALLGTTIQMNIGLAIFNLLPIPPLDGSRVVDWLVPYRFRPTWQKIAQFAPLLLLGVIFFGGFILETPREWVNDLLDKILRVAAGY